MPKILESIKVTKEMRVALEYMGNPVHLPTWFLCVRDARLNNITRLEELTKYMQDAGSNNDYSILSQLEKRKLYKPKRRRPFLRKMIRFALLARYTSAQAYQLILKMSPYHPFQPLRKFKKWD